MFSAACSDISGILPDPSFDAWAEDSLLPSGVAINPQAAAHCAHDYQRSVVFIRGVHAAMNALKLHFAGTPLEILYAGCGPFATLLMPLFGKFSPGDLNITLLDIHQRSLDSAELLVEIFGFGAHGVTTVQGDASTYRHPQKLHMVIAETMQKSLEQEPQFAVTANLAPQILAEGVFIPQRIDVSLALADLEQEKVFYDNLNTRRYPIATLASLSPDNAFAQSQAAQYNLQTNMLELQPTLVEIPLIEGIDRLNAALFTRITVYECYCLEDYEAEITLPMRCYELEPLRGGERYSVSYQLGAYPKFNFEPGGKLTSP
ncbi:MAG: hypothetical protein ACI8QT_001639 [Halioglobus sp.]|jgi:hypothetical protein